MNETLLNKARLNVVSLNKALINGAVERHGSSAGGGGAPSKYIRFADPAVEAVLMANGVSSDGVGITKEDAASVTSIGTWFKGNTEITSFNELKYFTGVTEIKANAFNSCSSLASINLDNVTIIRNAAFFGCSSLSQYIRIPQVTILENQSFRNSGIVGADISGVQVLTGGHNGGAFGACSSLREVIFSPSLTDIQQFSFINCTALEIADIPASVTTIGTQAFYNCTSLAFDYLSLPNLTSIGTNAFYGVKIKKLSIGVLATSASDSTQNYGDKQTLEEIILTDAITSIPNYSFVSYTNAKFVMNQTGITSIGSGAFKNSGLDGEVNFPNLTGIVGESAFSASKIVSVKNLGNITEIGAYAFQNCDSLEFVDLPATLTNIGNYAFSDNATPMTMVCRAITPPTLATKFTSSTITAIYVPDAALEVYKTATNWSAYADRIHPLSELEGSPYITFADAEVERVLMENNVSSDGVGITMADAEAVTSIGTWFKGNTAIQSFDELEKFTNVKWLLAEAFSGCTSLQSISLKNIESTGYDALKQTALSHVDAPLLGFVNSYAFTEISSDFSINLPSCTTIYKNGFYKSGLQKISCTNLLEIQDNGLKDTRLKEIFLPNVKTIGIDGLNLCPYLAKVDIGSDATSIGNFAFGNSTSLETLIVRATTPPSAGRLILENTAIDSANGFIYVPDASVDAYKAAANWSQYQDRIRPLSETIEGLQFFDKLTGDGVAYINTEYYPIGTDSIAWDANRPAYYNKFIYGVKSKELNLGALIYAVNNSYFLAGPTIAIQIDVDNSGRITQEMKVTKIDDRSYHRELLSGGVIVYDFGTGFSDFTLAKASNPLYLFACQAAANNTLPDRAYSGDIYSFAIRDVDGNIKMSMRPCILNGEAGMYDEVSCKFYGNSASKGSFNASND